MIHRDEKRMMLRGVRLMQLGTARMIDIFLDELHFDWKHPRVQEMVRMQRELEQFHADLWSVPAA